MQKTATLSISDSLRPAPMSSWIVGGLFGITAMTTAAVTIMTVVNGPRIRAEIAAENAAAVTLENRSVCGKLGAGPETSRFAECAAALADVRARHDERNATRFY